MTDNNKKGYRFSIYINQHMAMELGIENTNQAFIFDLLANASSWANPEIVDGEVYYWVSRGHVCQQLPFLKMKHDTVYRHYKGLHNIGLIKYIKVGKKDCFRVTEKGKTYFQMNQDHYVGNKSELGVNPYVGNKSESNSEINPTYKTYNTIDNTLPEKSQKLAESTKPKSKALLAKETMRDTRFKEAFVKLFEENEVNPTAQIWKLTTGSFLDYWMQDTTAKYKKADWLATWRNWVRKDVKDNGWRYRIEQQKAGNSIMPKNDQDLPLDDNLLVSWAKKHKAPMPIAAADYTYQKYRSDLQTWAKRQEQAA